MAGTPPVLAPAQFEVPILIDLDNGEGERREALALRRPRTAQPHGSSPAPEHIEAILQVLAKSGGLQSMLSHQSLGRETQPKSDVGSNTERRRDVGRVRPSASMNATVSWES